MGHFSQEQRCRPRSGIFRAGPTYPGPSTTGCAANNDPTGPREFKFRLEHAVRVGWRGGAILASLPAYSNAGRTIMVRRRAVFALGCLRRISGSLVTSFPPTPFGMRWSEKQRRRKKGCSKNEAQDGYKNYSIASNTRIQFWTIAVCC